MKAKNCDKKIVLYYGLKNIQQEKQLDSILRDLDITGIKVEKRDLHRSVGELAEIQSSSENAASFDNAPDASAIVMHCFEDSDIGQLLDDIKTVPDLQIKLKAVITENNINWPFGDLIKELQQEHQFMQIYMSTYNVTQHAEQWLARNKQSPSQDDPKQNLVQELVLNIEQAKSLIAEVQSQKEIDIEQLATIGRRISMILKKL